MIVSRHPYMDGICHHHGGGGGGRDGGELLSTLYVAYQSAYFILYSFPQVQF